MKPHHFFACLAWLAISQINAQTYICVYKGKPVYTTLKLNNTCTASNMDGIASASQVMPIITDTAVSSEVALPVATASTPSVPQIIDDEISKIWTKNELGSFDDTVILPPVQKVVALDAPNVKTKIRQAIRQVAPVVAAPTTRPPQLTRRQLLQQELSREKTALARAQSSLNAARSKNDHAQVRHFDAQVRDRQLNIQALEQEMRR